MDRSGVRRTQPWPAAAADVLTVPVLAAPIPSTIDVSRHAALAELALRLDAEGLLDLGTIRVGDVRGLERACNAVVQAAVEHTIGSLRLLRLRVELVYEFKPERGRCVAALRLSTDETLLADVSRPVQRLERRAKGLGRTALLAIERLGLASIPVMLPSDQLPLAEYLCWGGNRDENEYADEFAQSEEERAEIIQSTFKRRDVERGTPRTILTPKPMRRSALRALARERGKAGEIAALCERVVYSPVQHNPHLQLLYDDGGTFVGFAAALRWGTTCFTYDLLDILRQRSFEDGDAFDIAAYVPLWTENAEVRHGLTEALASLMPVVDGLRDLDALLSSVLDSEATTYACPW